MAGDEQIKTICTRREPDTDGAKGVRRTGYVCGYHESKRIPQTSGAKGEAPLGVT